MSSFARASHSIGGGRASPIRSRLTHLRREHFALSRTFLLRHLWPDDYEGLDRTVDALVIRLRKKLGAFGERIVTVWSVGYRFEP